MAILTRTEHMRETKSIRHITVSLDLIFFSRIHKRSSVTWFSLNSDMTGMEGQDVLGI